MFANICMKIKIALCYDQRIIERFGLDDVLQLLVSAGVVLTNSYTENEVPWKSAERFLQLFLNSWRASLMCYKVIYIYLSQDVQHLFALISVQMCPLHKFHPSKTSFNILTGNSSDFGVFQACFIDNYC